MFETISHWLAQQWQECDRRLKKLVLIVAGVSTIYLALTLGTAFTHFLYAFTVGGLIGGYLMFPDDFEAWFDYHEPKLLGAALGFFVGHGVIGLAVGAWLGYFCQQRYEQLCNRVEGVRQMAEPVVGPMNTAGRSIRAGLNIARQAAQPIIHPVDTANRGARAGWYYAQAMGTQVIRPFNASWGYMRRLWSDPNAPLGIYDEEDEPTSVSVQENIDANNTYMPAFTSQQASNDDSDEDEFFDCEESFEQDQNHATMAPSS